MTVFESLKEKLKKGPLHFTLIDPEKAGSLEEKVGKLKEFATDAVLIGGSTGIKKEALDETIKTIKKASLPVILFPGDANGVSRFADALFFMSLLNSKDPYWISGIQSSSSLMVKKTGIETIPMAYIIFEPGMKAGEVGKANAIKRDDYETAKGYAAAAQLMGFDIIYLESGSGAPRPLPAKTIIEVKSVVDIPIIVGGGIRTAAAAKEVLKAGADIIVTGTIAEKNFSALKEIICEVKSFKKL